jgi:hypothetical protein
LRCDVLAGILEHMVRALVMLVVMLTTCLCSVSRARANGSTERATSDPHDPAALTWLAAEASFELEELEELEEEDGSSSDGPDASPDRGDALVDMPRICGPAWWRRARRRVVLGAARGRQVRMASAPDRRALVRRCRCSSHVPRMDADPYSS